MNLSLPESTHAAVFRKAKRRRVPATRLVRSVLSDWLAAQARERAAEAIRRFAETRGGSATDLDPALETAGLELIDADPDDAAG